MFLEKSKIKTVWNRKKKIFFSSFISENPKFSYLCFFGECSIFRRSIPLNGFHTSASKTSLDAKSGVEDFRLLPVYLCFWYGEFGQNTHNKALTTLMLVILRWSLSLSETNLDANCGGGALEHFLSIHAKDLGDSCPLPHIAIMPEIPSIIYNTSLEWHLGLSKS